MENEGSTALLKLVAKYFGGSLVFFLVAVKFVKISAFGAQLFLLLVAAYLFLLASFKFIELVDAEDCIQCLYCTPWIILFFWVLLFYSFTVISTDAYSSEQYLLFFYVKIILFATSCIIFVKLLRYSAGRQFQRVLVNVCVVILVTSLLLFRAAYYQSLDDSLLGLDGKRLSNSDSSCQIEPIQKPLLTLLPSVISSVDVTEAVKCGVIKRNFCHKFLGMVTIDGSCSSDNRVIILNNDHISDLSDDYSVGLCKNMSRFLHIGVKKSTVNYTSPLYNANDLRFINCFCDNEENVIPILPPKPPPRTAQANNHAPNILMILINSISRNQFHEHLPKTVDVLDTFTENGFSVFQFFRFHSMGKTFQENFVPLMSGRASGDIPITNDRSGTIFPWSHYQGKHGFETSWISNECADNFYFNFQEPFNIDNEIVLPFCHPNFRKYRNAENFDGPFPSKKRCIGTRNAHDLVFEYLHEIYARDGATGKFTMAHLFGGQEGGREMLVHVDKSVSAFLKSFIGYLGNTVTFIISDSGLNHGLYANTAYGDQDRKLPALFMIVHNKLLEQYDDLHRALLLNEQRLITPYDVHRTLHHLAVYPDKLIQPKGSYGQSLLEEVPVDRSCSDSAIPPHECVCL